MGKAELWKSGITKVLQITITKTVKLSGDMLDNLLKKHNRWTRK